MSEIALTLAHLSEHKTTRCWSPNVDCSVEEDGDVLQRPDDATPSTVNRAQILNKIN